MFLALEILHEEFATVEVGVVVVARIPRAVHAGRAAQGVHLQAGVVAHRGQARGLHRGLGLEEGVLLKGLARLVHFEIAAGLPLGDDLYARPG